MRCYSAVLERLKHTYLRIQSTDRQAIALGNNVMIIYEKNTKNVLFDAISVYALKTLKHQK